ncbi:NADH-quinone oxidoreductase subunit J [Thermosyntropha lipolytica DSM 11003]|uniref:NADH-quinone oxidoreductase subunit J n=1 Tax=Thermosyntropha lipolytica DSM 11003 TaxID=1123382 RepID=A0A1M5P3R7_9FIRM|nr:NADH-quinone oxidoreductase subunit J [Thermosyntropha lipolytica]SHG96464.1 NADH-quinone oxidoreductase subunit J [Thermosyntropha lipolytica DSM 11003]
MQLSDLVFYALAAFTIIAALGVVALPNIVHSALCLVLTFIGVAGIYFYLGADFIGLIQILAYAGAISVLMIFAVMLLLSRDVSESNPSHKKGKYLAALFSGLFAFLLALSIYSTSWDLTEGAEIVDSIGKIAYMLMGDYVIAFEAAAILLLAAVIGAVILARGEEKR